MTRSQIAIPPRVRLGRSINVGLDFGTHSTKVVVRSHGDQKAWVLFLDTPSPEYPNFSAPSVVCLKQGKLFFGQRALSEETGGHLFRSLKVDLLPPSRPGTWGGSAFPIGTTPDLLVAAYLCWILGRVKDLLGGGNLPRPSLNIAAPMDHFENSSLKHRYLSVVHAAWEASIGNDALQVTQGIDLTTVQPTLDALLSAPVPGSDLRRFEVLPETLAPVVSLFQDPQIRPGLFMMVDMGAGTTEISVSRVTDGGSAERLIACCADSSIVLGGDQFCENDHKNEINGKAHLNEQERLTKEFLKSFRSVWYDGYKKDADGGYTARYSWLQLRVILVGGGLRRRRLENAVGEECPQEDIFQKDKGIDYKVGWHQPANLEGIGGDLDAASGELSNSLAFLAVAHGLSLERQNWPKFFCPDEVEPRSPSKRPESPFERRYSESDVG